MSGVGIAAIVLGVIGGVALVAALARMWVIAGEGEDPVGGWTPDRPGDGAPVVIPRDFRSLLAGEKVSWHHPGTWEHLTKRLDTLEISLGGSPVPPPQQYSRPWLEHRIARIEALAGPAPTAQL